VKLGGVAPGSPVAWDEIEIGAAAAGATATDAKTNAIVKVLCTTNLRFVIGVFD
jgi:hypothetical protein